MVPSLKEKERINTIRDSFLLDQLVSTLNVPHLFSKFKHPSYLKALTFFIFKQLYLPFGSVGITNYFLIIKKCF